MLKGFQNIFQIPELKKRILFTLGAIAIFRIGSYIPSPGVDGRVLAEALQAQAGGIFSFLNLFSGGSLYRFSVFALNIMPYISASIILQLLQAVIPSLEALAKEGEEGRRKINQYTRYLTVLLCVIEGLGMTIMMRAIAPGAIRHWGISFQIMTILTLTTGTMFLMWLGDQVTERGVGNGMSIIIFANIISRYPEMVVDTIRQINMGLNIFSVIVATGIVLADIFFIVLISQARRKIPVQYAQRVVGRRIYGGQSTFLPLRVDQAGVIAIIFAGSILAFPAQIASYFPQIPFMVWIRDAFGYGRGVSWLYTLVYAVLIIFFCYFYTAVVVNPNDIAENMKKYGGFIPGIRPGRQTSEYIDRVLTRITLVGAVSIAIIAVVPDVAMHWFRLPPSWSFGGTSLLIVVGVALDTLSQIESHLLMRHYEGFIKRGKLKARVY